jgi:hypothetical protein
MQHQPDATGDPEDQTKYMLEIVQAVGDELLDRLGTDLDEKDQVAVTTAIGKAARRGMLRGFAVCAYAVQQQMDDVIAQLRAQLPPQIELSSEIRINAFLQGPEGDIGPEPDPWDDIFGPSSPG